MYGIYSGLQGVTTYLPYSRMEPLGMAMSRSRIIMHRFLNDFCADSHCIACMPVTVGGRWTTKDKLANYGQLQQPACKPQGASPYDWSECLGLSANFIGRCRVESASKLLLSGPCPAFVSPANCKVSSTLPSLPCIVQPVLILRY